MNSRVVRNSNVDEHGPPASVSTVYINREDANLRVRTNSLLDNNEDGNDPNLHSGRSLPDRVGLNARKNAIKIATWNVRTMYQKGKIDNAIQEMKSMNVDILGISEMRWTDSGKMRKNGYTVVFSGDGKEHRNGVGFIIKDNIAKSLMGFWPISDRSILIKLEGKPFNISIIQIYAPTQDHGDEEVEAFYEEIEKAIKIVKSDEVLIVMGDWNAKAGSYPISGVMGRFGLGNQNERGQRLQQFCVENRLVISNTFFQQSARRTYTWKSPGDMCRNQIDYILIRNRFKNAVKQVKTYPGADIGSDHIPVTCKIQIKVKKPQKSAIKEQHDLNKLQDEQTRMKYNLEIRNYFEALEAEETEQQPEANIEEEWQHLKLSIISASKKFLPKKKKTSGKEWMTEEILAKMEKRKAYKNEKEKYQTLDREIHKMCDNAKEEWINKNCAEIEELEAQHKTRQMYEKVKEVTGTNRRRAGNNCVTNKDGRVLFDQQEIQDRWKEYIEELFEDERGDIPQMNNTEGPVILKEEVRNSINSLKPGKAPGDDEISTEMLQALDEIGIDKITELCNKIYDTGYIPDDMKKSTFIPLPKKSKAVNCTDFRTISLMSHVTKILLKIILYRNSAAIDREIGENQSGFRKGKGTREGIFNLRTISERYLEKQKDLYICFIDYEKAFDRVNHEKLIEKLKLAGLDGKDVRIIARLYWEQAAVVRTEQGNSEGIKIRRGTRQGCVLSPYLFNLFTELIFRVIENEDEGVSVGGRRISNLRYADDTAITAENENELQILAYRVNEEGKHFGMKMNIKKTKTMVISKKKELPNVKIQLDGQAVEQVHKFVYLGELITENGKCEEEIRRRIEIARKSFSKMRTILTNPKISVPARLRFIKCYVWSTLLYGVETWTISKVSQQRLEAFEMWTLRRMLRISWTRRVTNEEVLHIAGASRSLFDTAQLRKLSFFGHIMRHDSLQRDLVEGMVEGKRGRGRPRMQWSDNITHWTGLTFVEAKRTAQDRRRWRFMAGNVKRHATQ